MASNELTAQFDPYQEMENYLERVAVSFVSKKCFFNYSAQFYSRSEGAIL
jgi:hypothetical protein